MTRAKAEAFLERNPKIKDRLLEMRNDAEKGWPALDRLWLFGLASNEKDALTDTIQVAEAMGWKL